MKNNELYQLADGLGKMGDLTGVKFAYAIVKNKRIVEDEIKLLSESLKASDKFTEFDKKRVEIVKEHADKDEKGEAKIEGNQYVVSDTKAMEAAIDPLKEEYKDAIEAREAQIKEFSEMLEKEINIELYKIKQDDLPKDISVAQLESIRWIVEE
jgi:hypothetical protein